MKISIVIPTYNRSNTIKYCLESICNQSLSPFEIIVVDDCSSDNTVDIINSLSNKRIKSFVLREKSGAQEARNRGIREAKGDWIAFQDSDDEWLPEKLEKQVAMIAKTHFDPYTVIHSNAFLCNARNKKLSLWKLPLLEGASERIYPKLLSRPGTFFPALLVSKVALEKINLLDTKVPSYQEWDTSIRLAKHCRFIHIREPLFIYHLHDEDTISKDITRDFIGYKYVIEKHEKDIKTYCGEKAWKQQLSILLRKCLESRSMEEFDNLIRKYLITDKYIERAYVKYISHCLDHERWIEADLYFSKCATDNLFILSLLKLCRIFHLKPSNISKSARTLIRFRDWVRQI